MNIESKVTINSYGWIFLLCVFTLGVWCRLDNLLVWYDFPEAAFINGQPLLTNFDGYYYLRLARDLLEGSYDAIDKTRAVPDYFTRPLPPPLLSYLIAKITAITPFSLEWVSVVLPAILGSLIVLPLFGQSAEKKWRKLRGFRLLAEVIRGVQFKDGERVDQLEDNELSRKVI